MENNILTHTDINAIPNTRSDYNGIVIDAKTLAVMKEIVMSLARLEPVGDDNRRDLWIRVDPGKPEDWDDYEEMKAAGDVESYDEFINLWKECVNEDALWYRISVGYFDDFYYMFISDGERITWELKSAMHIRDKDSDCPKADFSETMSKIRTVIDETVDSITNDGGVSYMKWVKDNLPYSKRHGTIRRNRLYQILGENWLDNFNCAKLIDILESDAKPQEYDGMTLRRYIDMWVKCYRAVYPGKFEDTTTEKMFEWLNSKGDEAFKYDLDSKEDFAQWEDENAPYHCNDVVYARVQLWVREHKDTGKCNFVIHTSSYWNLGDYLKIVEKLYDEGIILEYSNKEKILPILKQADLVEITPSAYRYFQEDGIGSQMSLFDIPEELMEKVIAETKWQKPIEVTPAKP